jgi:redox-sensitive bicupin YhaK (pirin superfamily)
LQTVTWLFAGEVVHNDSLNNECLVRPGRLSLMTAGRGIAHTEETPRRNSGVLDGVQLWVALPEGSRQVAPMYQCTGEQPVVLLSRCRITGIMGEFAGATSIGTSFSSCVAADLKLEASSEVTLPLRKDFEYGVVLVSGDAEVLEEPLCPDTLYYAGMNHEQLQMRTRVGARLLLIGGTPFTETILMWWNFVARSAEEIAQARQAWERHELFGDVPRYSGPRLAAPAFLGRPMPSPPPPESS